MSDGEYDQEGWGSSDGSGAGQSDDDHEIENAFYEGEAIWRDKNYAEAKEKFEVVVTLAEGQDVEMDLCFKATKYLVLINMILG